MARRNPRQRAKDKVTRSIAAIDKSIQYLASLMDDFNTGDNDIERLVIESQEIVDYAMEHELSLKQVYETLKSDPKAQEHFGRYPQVVIPIVLCTIELENVRSAIHDIGITI